MTSPPISLAVLLSGGGRSMANLQEKIAAGALPARIEVVVSSRADAKGVERARCFGLRTLVVDRRSLTAAAFQDQLTSAVGDADLVCMAGFLSLWRIPPDRLGKVINIHPALLPDFGGPGMYGSRVHQAVLDAGVSESGCTVHFCDNEYDHGPVILQRRVPVQSGDTVDALAARVFAQECIAYPDAIDLFARRKIQLSNGQVVLG